MLAAENLRDAYQFRKAQDALLSSAMQRQKDLLTLARDTAEMENLDQELADERAQADLKRQETEFLRETAQDRFGLQRDQTALARLKTRLEAGITPAEYTAREADLRHQAATRSLRERVDVAELGGKAATLEQEEALRPSRFDLERTTLDTNLKAARDLAANFDQQARVNRAKLDRDGKLVDAQNSAVSRIPEFNSTLSDVSRKLADPKTGDTLFELTQQAALLPEGHPTALKTAVLARQFERVQQYKTLLREVTSLEIDGKRRANWLRTGEDLLNQNDLSGVEKFISTLPTPAAQKLRAKKVLEQQDLRNDLYDQYNFETSELNDIESGKVSPSRLLQQRVQAAIDAYSAVPEANVETENEQLTSEAIAIVMAGNQPTRRLVPKSADELLKFIEEQGPEVAKKVYTDVFSGHIDAMQQLRTLRTTAASLETVARQTDESVSESSGKPSPDAARRKAREEAAQGLVPPKPPKPAPR